MFVGILQMTIEIVGARSLKEKRRVVRSLQERLRRRFSVAVAEVDHMDVWQRAGLGIAVVSNEHGHAAALLEGVVRFVSLSPDARVLDHQIEVL